MMRLLTFLLSFLTACFSSKTIKSKPEQLDRPQEISFYDFKIKSIDGEEIDFSEYKGKKLLLVNVASKCGYTPQYKDLQALHEKYGDKLVILGFPANNFLGQEPGTNEDIAKFCKDNYQVTFQLFEKIDVIGKNKHPLYQWLSSKDHNGWNDQEPTWNFCKYLVNEKGELMKFYGQAINPMDEQILNELK